MMRKVLPKNALRDKVGVRDICPCTVQKSKFQIFQYFPDKDNVRQISRGSENSFAEKLKLQVIVNFSGMRA